MIHPTSDVQTRFIGDKTKIWQYCVVLGGARIGADCNICAFVFIENDVLLGDRVTIKSGVQLWDGIIIEDDVFVGPNVTFTNDKYPRSKFYPKEFMKTHIRRGATIGANATILPGLEIGAYSIIGAGSVVTTNVPARAMVVGNPAHVVKWVNINGEPMKQIDDNTWIDCDGAEWFVEDNVLISKS